MLAISILWTIGIGIGCFILGIAVCFALVSWAYKEEVNKKPQPVMYDENSYS